MEVTKTGRLLRRTNPRRRQRRRSPIRSPGRRRRGSLGGRHVADACGASIPTPLPWRHTTPVATGRLSVCLRARTRSGWPTTVTKAGLFASTRRTGRVEPPFEIGHAPDGRRDRAGRRLGHGSERSGALAAVPEHRRCADHARADDLLRAQLASTRDDHSRLGHLRDCDLGPRPHTARSAGRQREHARCPPWRTYHPRARGRPRRRRRRAALRRS